VRKGAEKRKKAMPCDEHLTNANVHSRHICCSEKMVLQNIDNKEVGLDHLMENSTIKHAMKTLEGPRTDSNKSNICNAALNIVLQHLLTPDMGWSVTSPHDRVHELQTEMIQHLISKIDEKDRAKRLQAANEIENKIMNGSKFDMGINLNPDNQMHQILMNAQDYLPAPLTVSLQLRSSVLCLMSLILSL
jgi:hypothetical protein